MSGPADGEDELDLLRAAEDDPTEVVATVGDLDPTVVLLREFLHRSGALRAVAVVERAGELPAVVDCARLAPIEVDLGGRVVHLPHAIELDAEAPPLGGDFRQLPPFEVDAGTGEVRSMIGGLQHAVEQVTALADALGGRNVALAQYPTLPVEQPLSITARAGSGEAPVIALGDEAFELPEEAGD